VVEAVGYHHMPGNCPARGLGPLTAVHAANVLAHEKDAAAAVAPLHGLDMEYLEHLDLAGRLPVWRALIEQASREQRAA
jgi:hypothetical protein